MREAPPSNDKRLVIAFITNCSQPTQSWYEMRQHSRSQQLNTATWHTTWRGFGFGASVISDRWLHLELHLAILLAIHRSKESVTFDLWWAMEETIDYGELRPVPTPKKLRRPNLTFRWIDWILHIVLLESPNGGYYPTWLTVLLPINCDHW